jgi:hypothetical protein
LDLRRWIKRDVVDYESIAYKHNFLHEAGRECGDFTSMLPWMEDGEMHMRHEQILTAMHVRFIQRVVNVYCTYLYVNTSLSFIVHNYWPDR